MRHSPWLTGLALAVALAIAAPWSVLARGGGGHSGGHSSSGHSYSHRSSSNSHSGSHIKCESCARDSHGRIKRDPKAVEQFKRTHPKPPGCKDCQVDHIIPLSKGGRDDPSNMQWLSKKEHQEKTGRDLRTP